MTRRPAFAVRTAPRAARPSWAWLNLARVRRADLVCSDLSRSVRNPPGFQCAGPSGYRAPRGAEMRWLVGTVVLGSMLACAGGAPPPNEPGYEQPAPASEAAVSAPPMATSEADDGLVDAAAWFNGGRELTPEGEVDVNHAAALFDRVRGSEWHCTIGEERCEAIVELNEPFDLEKLVYVSPAEPNDRVREIAVDVGPAAAGPWTEIGRVQTANSGGRQSFPLAAKAARFARIRPTASWSDTGFYGFDDVELRGRRSERHTYDWNGTWIHLSNNPLSMTQTGDRVVGCFAGQDRFEGTVDGPIFTGIYHDIDGDTVTDSRLVLAMTPDRAIHGVRSDDLTLGAALSNRWDAVATTEYETVRCDPPVEEQPGEIEQDLAKDGRLVLYGVLFDFDKDTLKPESDKVLGALAKAIAAKPERKYRIEGHTDDKGGAAYNQDLSERRAKAVVRWLVDHGAPADKLEAAGFGASSPVLPNDTAAGRAANRRVEVALTE